MAPIPALWATKKYDSQPYKKNGTVIVDLRKAGMTNEFISRIMVRLTGTVDAKAVAAVAASGLDNPEGLLTSSVFQVAPTPAGASIPFNQVTGRGLRWIKAINKEKFTAYTAIVDGGGVQTVFWEYEFIFKRNHVRKNVEYGFDLSKFTSAVLNLTFGDQITLFPTTTNVYDFTNLTVETWCEIGYNVNPEGLHAVEAFEQSFPILAAGDLLINQLPAGVLYSDLYLIAEKNNVPFDGIVGNVDIEGGGRNWTYPGDSNAALLRDCYSQDCFDGSVAVAGVAGAYLFRMRDGTFLRSIDARESQIIIKVNVLSLLGGTCNLRVIGKKMVPYGVKALNKPAAGTGKATGKR